MPIYEYECTSCHHHFDLMQKITEDPTKQCPSCFEYTAVRLISPAGFQLKGTGWYATDFKNKNAPESKKNENGNDQTTRSTTEEKKPTDTKTSTNSAKGEKD